MTGNSARAPSFRLRTFGTLTLSGPDDATVLGQHGHHRRRLALLAVLAAAADRGWSRDHLEDPTSPTAAADVGEGLCINRRYDEGLATLEPLTSLTPPVPRVPAYKAVCYLMQRQWALAIAQLGDGTRADPWSALLGYAVAKSGDTVRALRMQSEAIQRYGETGRGAIRVVYIAEGLGNRDTAFAWLDCTEGDPVSAIMYPFFSGLQADRRFARFRERLGLK